MITVKTNIKVVSSSLIRKLDLLRDPRPLLRPVALDVIVMMTERIHEKGLAADGSKIGDYNNHYLRLRENHFKRSGDKKIIVSLTRQLENDWSVIATQNGWGIGFKNPDNAQKLLWVEEQKKKRIGTLTKEEREYAINKLKSLVHQQLNS